MEAKRCWLARRIRGVILLPVVGLIAVITMPPPSAGASGLRVASGGSAITRIDALERAWHERAVALGQRSAPARPIGQSDAAVRAASLVAAGVQQISRDTLTGRGAERDTQVEPDIAIDPTSSSTVVAVYQQGRYQGGGSAGPGYATSQDGGRTWTQGDLPNLTTATGGRWDRASDPAVVIGPDGSVYAQTLTIDLTPENGVAVQRSDNGGLTFNDPVLVEDNTDGVHFDDKNWIAVDTFPSSPHYGRIYSVWDRFDASNGTEPEVLSYSDDRGQTWSTPGCASPCDDAAIGAIPVVQPNGDLTVVYVSFLACPAGANVATTSHDGGVTFDPPVRIDCNLGTSPADLRDGGGLPAATVDPVTGALYTVWQDSRYRGGGAVNDVVISASVDGGASWSLIARVNQDALDDGLHHFTPAVAAYGGVVHVAYRTRSMTPSSPSRFVDERVIQSTDGGVTWGAETIIGPVADLQWAAQVFFDGTRFLGDYMGLAASPRELHAAWCRSSQPSRGRIYHQTTWGATIKP